MKRLASPRQPVDLNRNEKARCNGEQQHTLSSGARKGPPACLGLGEGGVDAGNSRRPKRDGAFEIEWSGGSKQSLGAGKADLC